MKIFNALQEKFRFDLTAGWLPFLNTQLKWAVGFFIRTLAMIGTIIVVLLVVHWTGVLEKVKVMVVSKQVTVKDKGTVTVSVPLIDYTDDLKNIDSIIDMLNKNKENQNATTTEQTSSTQTSN